MESDCKVTESGPDFTEGPAAQNWKGESTQHSWGVALERIKHFMSMPPSGLQFCNKLVMTSVIQRPQVGRHQSGHLNFPQMPRRPRTAQGASAHWVGEVWLAAAQSEAFPWMRPTGAASQGSHGSGGDGVKWEEREASGRGESPERYGAPPSLPLCGAFTGLLLTHHLTAEDHT